MTVTKFSLLFSFSPKFSFQSLFPNFHDIHNILSCVTSYDSGLVAYSCKWIDSSPIEEKGVIFVVSSLLSRSPFIHLGLSCPRANSTCITVGFTMLSVPWSETVMGREKEEEKSFLHPPLLFFPPKFNVCKARPASSSRL